MPLKVAGRKVAAMKFMGRNISVVKFGGLIIADFRGGGELVPGAMPAFGAAGTMTTSNTLAATHNVAYPAGVTAGQLLTVIAAWRHNNGDGQFQMHPNMVADGWVEMSGSPFKHVSGVYGQHIYWKFATAAHQGNIPGGIIGSGGDSSDQVGIVCIRWTAADGFATNPFEGISSPVFANNQSTHPMAAVTTTDANRLAVQFLVFNASPANAQPGSATGETGGDWEEIYESGASVLTVQIQTAAMTNAGTISGGAVTTAQNCGGARFGFALVPDKVSA